MSTEQTLQEEATQGYYQQVVQVLQTEIGKLASEKAHLSVSLSTFQLVVENYKQENQELIKRLETMEKKLKEGGKSHGKNKNR